MKKRILFLLAPALILAATSTCRAGEAEDLFSQGNRAYAEENYQQALACYHRVMKQKGVSSSLLFNMANAYYHTEDIGNAVLYYERALYLDPGNTDIRTNLAVARKDFGLVEKDTGQWERYFHFFNLNGWAWLASASLSVFSLIFLLRSLLQRAGQNKLMKVASLVALFLFVVSGAGVVSQVELLDQGIVTAEGASLLVSPFDTAPKSSAIKDGRRVKIMKRYQDYLLVKESTGETGWIAEKAVKPIVPGSELG